MDKDGRSAIGKRNVDEPQLTYPPFDLEHVEDIIRAVRAVGDIGGSMPPIFEPVANTSGKDVGSPDDGVLRQPDYESGERILARAGAIKGLVDALNDAAATADSYGSLVKRDKRRASKLKSLRTQVSKILALLENPEDRPRKDQESGKEFDLDLADMIRARFPSDLSSVSLCCRDTAPLPDCGGKGGACVCPANGDMVPEFDRIIEGLRTIHEIVCKFQGASSAQPGETEPLGKVIEREAGGEPDPLLDLTKQARRIHLFAEVFQAQFSLDPRRSTRRTTDNFSGPFPVFITAVAKRLRWGSMDPRSISQALRRYFEGRSDRQGDKVRKKL